jgi:hypothetical protein
MSSVQTLVAGAKGVAELSSVASMWGLDVAGGYGYEPRRDREGDITRDVEKWCARQDSNLRPLASECKTAIAGHRRSSPAFSKRSINTGLN